MKLSLIVFQNHFTRDEFLSRSWNKPGTPGYIHQLGGLEKQGEDGRVSYDAENHQKMVQLRQQKINGMAREYTPLVIEGDVNASILLIGWGSTYGSLKSTVLQCSEEGLAIALIHLRHLNPLPRGTIKSVS